MEDQADRREPDVEGVNGYELLAGAALPIEADLRFEITRSHPDDAAEALPPGTAEPLLEQQDKLLAWLAKSEENRIDFLLEPVESLERAGLELDPDVLGALRAAHERAAAAEALPPGVSIGKLQVEVAPEREQPCREGSEPKEA
jgi:hypothetical protein